MIDATAYLRLEVEVPPPAGKSKNLVKNPDGLLGGFAWNTPPVTGVSSGSVSRSPLTSPSRVRYTQATATGRLWQTERMPVTVGQYVSARWVINSQTTNAGVTTRIDWFDANGANLGSPATVGPFTPSVTERTIGPHVVPANVVTARLTFFIAASTSPGENTDLSLVTFVCRASSSAVVWATDVVYEGPTWLNILGPAIEIETERQALDVGTLSATIRDATLDPLTATTIRPGRACRLTALTISGVYDSVFEGEITEFDVDYEAEVLARKPGDPKHCRIEISALDRTRLLASVRRPEGVSTLLDLRDTLEDAGVPWSINGNTSQASTPPTIVSWNENASALDQVALTRDSRGAHAWVDRRGVLNVWDRTALAPFLNTSFDVDTAGWVNIGGATLTRVASPAFTATPGAGQVVSLGAGTAGIRATPMVRVIPGHAYSVSIRARAASAAAIRTCRVDLLWRDANGNALSTTTGVASTTMFGAWTTHTVNASTLQIPIGAEYLLVDVVLGTGAAAGETFWLDELTGINAEITLDQSVWTGIKIGGGSRQCINEVTVDYLRLIPASGTEPAKSEVIPYGPYRNEASIAEFGVRPRKFTIQGTSEASDVTTFAAAVLAANAFPKVSASEVTLPVKTAGDLTMTRAMGDLQQTAVVSFATKGYSERLRVTSVQHLIRSDRKYKARWIVKYGFESTSTVAQPRSYPAPPGAGRAALPDTEWQTVTYGAGFGDWIDTANELVRCRRRDGKVEVIGLCRRTGAGMTSGPIFQLPAGMRPNRNTWRVGNASAYRFAGYVVLTDGWCHLNGINGLGTLANGEYLTIAFEFPLDAP